MNLPITTRVSKARCGLSSPKGMEISMNADGSGGAVPDRNPSPAKKLRKAHSVKVNEAKAATYGQKPAFKRGDRSPAKQMDNKRSTKRFARAEKVAAKGKKAVDEGRDRKADRLLKRAARIENRAIKTEEYEKNYKPRSRKGVM